MGSTRLPGKVMRDLAGKPVIDHVIERVKRCARLDEIVVATTTLPEDAALAERAEKNGVTWFRGSRDDVLARYYHAARERGLDVIVRITADCPLIDRDVTGEVIGYFHAHDRDVVTNAGDGPGERTYPRGLDTEVFSFAALSDAHAHATSAFDREHVTPYLYAHGRAHVCRHPVDYSRYRWTLDTEDDFRFVRAVYERCYRGTHDFGFADILRLLEEHPELVSLNAHVEQKHAG
jgi:spore coat polysaccharide biosynthesis protein SpsF